MYMRFLYVRITLLGLVWRFTMMNLMPLVSYCKSLSFLLSRSYEKKSILKYFFAESRKPAVSITIAITIISFILQ